VNANGVRDPGLDRCHVSPSFQRNGTDSAAKEMLRNWRITTIRTAAPQSFDSPPSNSGTRAINPVAAKRLVAEIGTNKPIP